MNKNIPFKKAFLAAAMGLLSTSAMADAGGDNWSLSGWINQGITYADDGENTDIVSTADNGATLGSRLTFAGSTDLPAGLNAGFEVIIEPRTDSDGVLGFGSTGATIGSPNSFSNATGDTINILGHSVFFGGAWGKLTFGLQSMPTDNIAVLEDPSLTLWASISPVFRGNNIGLQNGGVPVTMFNPATGLPIALSPGDALQCFGVPGLNIGIDCNGIYRQGLRYDLPTFIENLSLAVGWANDDVYDVMGKYHGNLGRVKGSIAIGYSMNNGTNTADFGSAGDIGSAIGAFLGAGAGAGNLYDSSDTFQMQAGLMDPVTGLFGSIAYQHEENDLLPGVQALAALFAAGGGRETDDTDAYWLKVGIKKQWNALGDTSLAFQYGSYNDQYRQGASFYGVNGSELERIGVEINQYFGSRLIIYGVWENLSVDVEGDAFCNGAYTPGGVTGLCTGANAADDVNTFTLGLTFFY